MTLLKNSFFIFVLLGVGVVFFVLETVFAASWTGAEDFVVGNWEAPVYLDDAVMVTRVELNKDNEIAVKAREFMEYLGYRVLWNERDRSIEFSKDEEVLEISINAMQYEKNGEVIELRKPVYMDHGYSYLPESFLLDALHLKTVSVDRGESANRVDGVFLYSIQSKLSEKMQSFLFGDWVVTKFLGFDRITKEDVAYPDGEDIIGATVLIQEDFFSSKDFGVAKYAVEIANPRYVVSDVGKGYDFAKYLDSSADESIRSLQEETMVMINAVSADYEESGLSGSALYVIDKKRLIISINCDYFELERVE